jgi:hypothetical protein
MRLEPVKWVEHFAKPILSRNDVFRHRSTYPTCIGSGSFASDRLMSGRIYITRAIASVERDRGGLWQSSATH